MWEGRDGSPPPVFTGAGSRREDNGWGRAGWQRDSSTSLRCVRNDMWGALRCARNDIWVEEGGWVPASARTREGAYFITICTRNRECLLGDVGEGRMHLNEAGLFAQAAWEDLPRHYPHVALDAWTIMPNHVHGIVVLTERVKAPPEGSGLKPDPTNANAVRHGLPEIVRAFKTFSARRINVFRGAVGARVPATQLL